MIKPIVYSWSITRIVNGKAYSDSSNDTGRAIAFLHMWWFDRPFVHRYENKKFSAGSSLRIAIDNSEYDGDKSLGQLVRGLAKGAVFEIEFELYREGESEKCFESEYAKFVVE